MKNKLLKENDKIFAWAATYPSKCPLEFKEMTQLLITWGTHSFALGE